MKLAFSMPPRLALRKAWRKLAGHLHVSRQRSVDFKASTYGAWKPSGKDSLGRFFGMLEMDSAAFPVEDLRENARRCLNHEFNLLGSGWTRVLHGLDCRGLEGRKFQPEPSVTADSEGRWLRERINDANLGESQKIWGLIEQNYVPLDWQVDFKSGFRWSERTWSPEIRYGDLPGADVKVPWELARSQHLPPLALAFGLTEEELAREELRREFRNQVLDFIATNPPRFGVNWVCAMDVGIRIANWLAAYDLFVSFGVKWDEPFERIFARSAREHAFHILHHLEGDPGLRSNHYLADITGLLFAAAHLPSDPETDSWLRFSAGEFVKEVENQFNGDGGNFEASTSYHRLSAEMAVYGTALILGLPENKWKVLGKEPREYLTAAHARRLEKMALFTMAVSHPDGRTTQVGDNDSGRFLRLLPEKPEEALDHRHLVAAVNGLVPRGDFSDFSVGKPWESRLVSALSGGKILSGPQEDERGPRQRSYPDFGLYILKKDPWNLVIRCGSVGQKGNGGHSHNDQLSFELSVAGTRIVVDPGTYVYTPLPEERNRFRSTAMHNTLSLAGMEQNTWEPGTAGLFQLRDRSKARKVRFDHKSFVGEHSGFGAVTRRTLNLKEGQLEGIDECPLPGEKVVFFHLAPGCQIQLYPPGEVEVNLGGVFVKFTSKEGRWSQENGFYSEAYGEKKPAPVLVLRSQDPVIAWKIQDRNKP